MSGGASQVPRRPRHGWRRISAGAGLAVHGGSCMAGNAWRAMYGHAWLAMHGGPCMAGHAWRVMHGGQCMAGPPMCCLTCARACARVCERKAAAGLAAVKMVYVSRRRVPILFVEIFGGYPLRRKVVQKAAKS